MNTDQAAAMRKGILNVSIPDKNALYQAYMPFLKNGGLFVQTTKRYALGDDVFVVLTLMDDKEKLPFVGRVAWVTPKGAHGNRAAGIGVQLAIDQGAREVRNKIETHLAGAMKSDRATHTM